MEITKSFTFDAAHRLPVYGEGHKYTRMHGHSFAVEVTLSGEPDSETGWVADFEQVSAAIAGVRDQLDHQTLNEVEGLEKPTLENICAWIAERLSGEFANLSAVRVSRPSIGESCLLRI